MPSLRERLASLESWKRAIPVAGLASIAYAGIVTGYGAQSTAIRISGSIWSSFGLAVVYAFGAIGVPVLLWLRYRIKTPAVAMALVLLFWHVVIHLPVVGSDGGDAPAFALVLFWAPFYLVAYGLLAGGEYWLRGRNAPVSALSRD